MTNPLTATPPIALDVHAVTKSYGTGDGAVPALGGSQGLDLAFESGSFTAVMGPSGSGKSTFLNIASGLERPDQGRVRIGGVDITEWDEEQRTVFRRDHIGMVFQSFHLIPYLTAEQNVGLPLRLAGRRPNRELVRDLLHRMGLGDRSRRLPVQLSGGQQQRVAIARALVHRPAVLLADEPTGALDSSSARRVLDLLRECTDVLGQTVVMVTHDPVAAARADSVAYLVDGQISGRMNRPTSDAVAAQLAHLDDLVVSR